MVKLLSTVSVVLALAVSLTSCSKKNTTPPAFDYSGTGVPVVGYPLTFESTIKNGVYAWAFGDGDTSTKAKPQHTYTKAGTYNVSLSVNGYTGYPLKKYIHIYNDPQYTINAGGTRNWEHTISVLQSGIETTYVRPDTGFALAYVNVITLKLGNETLTYDDTYTQPDVLHYVSRTVGSVTSQVDVYYYYRRDSLAAVVAHGNGNTTTDYFHTK